MAKPLILHSTAQKLHGNKTNEQPWQWKGKKKNNFSVQRDPIFSLFHLGFKLLI